MRRHVCMYVRMYHESAFQSFVCEYCIMLKISWSCTGFQSLRSRVPGPHTPPLPVPGPRPPSRPCSQRSRKTGTNLRKPEGGSTMENDPSQCFFTGPGAENRIRAGTRAPFARRKEQHHILYGNEHVTMTLLLTSGSNHTIPL